MNEETARALNAMNVRFYAQVCESFSETRSHAWPGWVRLLEEMRRGEVRLSSAGTAATGEGAEGIARVLDVACGNLRFERFLRERWGAEAFSFDAVDACAELLPPESAARFCCLDIVDSVISARHLACELREQFDARAYDLVTCFGFLHHVPGFENRVRLLRDLCACARPSGWVAVSLWRFLDDLRIAEKSSAAHEAGVRALAALGCEKPALEPNDCFLDWQGNAEALRYCHHFDEDEISALQLAVSDLADSCIRFNADGRTGNLNYYLVMRVA